MLGIFIFYKVNMKAVPEDFANNVLGVSMKTWSRRSSEQSVAGVTGAAGERLGGGREEAGRRCANEGWRRAARAERGWRSIGGRKPIFLAGRPTSRRGPEVLAKARELRVLLLRSLQRGAKGHAHFDPVTARHVWLALQAELLLGFRGMRRHRERATRRSLGALS